MNEKRLANLHNRKLPIGHKLDVEFSEELADRDDLEARERAMEADLRANEDLNDV